MNSGKTVVLSDFEHLNLATILGSSSLENFVTIKEPVYPALVQYFYSNHLLNKITSNPELWAEI